MKEMLAKRVSLFLLIFVAEDDLIFATYAHNAYKANEFWDSLKPEDQEKLIILKADVSNLH